MKTQIFVLFLLCAMMSFSQDSSKVHLYPARSYENGKIGYVNDSNEFVIDPQFSSGTYFEYGIYAAVSKKIDKVETYALIDSTGNYIISFDEGYEFIGPEDHPIKGWIKLIKNGKWGYVNDKNEVLIPLMYDNLGRFYGGLAYAKKDRKYGFIDTNNIKVIDFKYDWTLNFGIVQPDGLRYAPVEKGSKRGYINNKGELAIKYKFGYQFIDGLVTVKRRGKWGCINTEGKIIVPFEYDHIHVNFNKKIIVAGKDETRDLEDCFNWQGEFVETRTKN